MCDQPEFADKRFKTGQHPINEWLRVADLLQHDADTHALFNELPVAVVTSITLYALVPVVDSLSREFGAWLEGLPVYALVLASIIGCTLWLLSMYLLVRRRLAKGDQ